MYALSDKLSFSGPTGGGIPGLDSIKALSVCQPYASLLVAGIKTIETRKWATSYRGPLLICATKRELGTIHDLLDWDLTVANRLADALWGRPVQFGDQLPVGVAVGVVEVIDCRPMRYQGPEARADWALACCDPYPGAFALVCDGARMIKPFAVKGRQGFFDVPLAIRRQLDRI